MSLLSRFRKSVSPTKPKLNNSSTASSKKNVRSTDNAKNYHNKFNENSENSYRSYANSDDDEQLQQRVATNRSSSKKPSAANMLYGTPTLARSDTFTLETNQTNGKDKKNDHQHHHHKNNNNDRHLKNKCKEINFNPIERIIFGHKQ